MIIMKYVKRILFVFLIVISIASSCENKNDEHKYITFINRSDKDISCQEFWSGSISSVDTLFQCRIGTVVIYANSSRSIENSSRRGGWETDFKTIPYIQFLVMNDNIYSKYIGQSCEIKRENVPILHCYRLTLEDLQRMNWIVVYPPEESK
jgi:hypothetical protein